MLTAVGVGIVVHANQAALQTQSEVTIAGGKDVTRQAYRLAKQYVTQRLVAPGEARWPDWQEAAGHVFRKKDDLYVVVSWVEAQNSYGDVVKQKYTVHVVQQGDRLSVVYLRTFE